MSALRSAIETVLAEHGVQPHVDTMHSWRCNETDRFPDYCSCVPELVGDLEEVIRGRERAAAARMGVLRDENLRLMADNMRLRKEADLGALGQQITDAVDRESDQ